MVKKQISEQKVGAFYSLILVRTLVTRKFLAMF